MQHAREGDLHNLNKTLTHENLKLASLSLSALSRVSQVHRDNACNTRLFMSSNNGLIGR